MKTRSDYVSNSSSSSFVIAVDKKHARELSGKILLEFDIDDKMDTIIEDMEGLVQYFDDELGIDVNKPEEDEFYKCHYERYKRYAEKIKEGKAIIIGTVEDTCGESAVDDHIYNNGIQDVEFNVPVEIMEEL